MTNRRRPPTDPTDPADPTSRPGADASRTAGTVAIAASAVLLAVVGVALLSRHGSAHSRRPAAAPTVSAPAAPSPAAPTLAERSLAPVTAAPATATTAPAATPSPTPPPATEVVPTVPADVAAVARRFVTAWTAHDARPGRDHGYDDAAVRASAWAGPGLARQLSGSSPGTVRQWQQWTAAKALVTTQITSVTVPDGAPAVNASAGFVRVRYRLKTAPASRPATFAEDQVVLELHRGGKGPWQVTALPYV